jgi:hypothetical protein
MFRTTVISRCKQYRYTLWRHIEQPWQGPGHQAKTVAFIGLNPSTADATKDDPTIRRCRSFAKMWGMDWMVMLNLFAFRATKPAVMKKAVDPEGPDNIEWLGRILPRCERVVCAWGTHGVDSDTSRMIGKPDDLTKVMPLHCLGTNKDGTPKHPLYVPDRAILVPFPDPLATIW